MVIKKTKDKQLLVLEIIFKLFYSECFFYLFLGPPFAIYLGTDIQCLGGVDHDIKKSQSFSGLNSLNQNPATASRLRTWRSSGMGKKRKKIVKKKHSKRQKTTVVMTSTNESIQTLDCTSCSDSEASSEDEPDDVKVMTNNTNRMRKCTITGGDGKNKTGAKGGCVNTQTACGTVNGNKKAYYSPAEQRRGGGAGGGGDDGDDERGKPPRKPPDHTAVSKSSKIKKKEKTQNDEEVSFNNLNEYLLIALVVRQCGAYQNT